MRVLIVSQYWAPENGVPQRRLAWISEILVNAGHQVLVIAPPPNFSRKVNLRTWLRKQLFKPAKSIECGEKGEQILRTGFVPAGRSLSLRILHQGTVALGMLWAAAARRQIVAEFQPDLVVGTVPALPTVVVARLVAEFLKVPYAIDLRDAWPDLLRDWEKWNEEVGTPSIRERLLSKGPAQALVFFVEKVVESCLNRADGLVLTSSYLAQEMEKDRRQAGLRKIPIEVVRNVFPASVLLQKQPNPSKGSLNVLYAGTIGRAQQLSNAIYAVNLASQQGVEICLKILGDGAAKSSLEDLAKKLNVNVLFEGKAEPDKLRHYYEWADTALVHLAEWKPLERAVPSKTYELMDLGLHISAVARGETAEIVRNYEAGFVVEPGNPGALAREWEVLARNRDKLQVGSRASSWVEYEREKASPKALFSLLSQFEQGGDFDERIF